MKLGDVEKSTGKSFVTLGKDQFKIKVKVKNEKHTYHYLSSVVL